MSSKRQHRSQYSLSLFAVIFGLGARTADAQSQQLLGNPIAANVEAARETNSGILDRLTRVCNRMVIHDDSNPTCPRLVRGEPCTEARGVGAIYHNGAMHCTGSLISPTHVLTAAHCALGRVATNMEFRIGPNSFEPDERFRVRTSIIFPGTESLPAYPGLMVRDGVSDLAILVLEHAVTDVTPIPYAHRAPVIHEQKSFHFMGYGFNGPRGSPQRDLGMKQCADIPVQAQEVRALTFRYQMREANTCDGDSGGPALDMINGRWVIAGITSVGDENCIVFGINTRVDPYATWIDGIVNGTEPVSNSNSFGTQANSSIATVTTAASRDTRQTNVGPWVVVGLGGASLAASAIFWGLSIGQQARHDELCVSNGLCFPSAEPYESRASAYRGVAIGTAVVGVLAVAGGLIWRFNSTSNQPSTTVAITPGYGGFSAELIHAF